MAATYAGFKQDMPEVTGGAECLGGRSILLWVLCEPMCMCLCLYFPFPPSKPHRWKSPGGIILFSFCVHNIAMHRLVFFLVNLQYAVMPTWTHSGCGCEEEQKTKKKKRKKVANRANFDCVAGQIWLPIYFAERRQPLGAALHCQASIFRSAGQIARNSAEGCSSPVAVWNIGLGCCKLCVALSLTCSSWSACGQQGRAI